jgi:hypothetical protein
MNLYQLIYSYENNYIIIIEITRITIHIIHKYFTIILIMYNTNPKDFLLAFLSLQEYKYLKYDVWYYKKNKYFIINVHKNEGLRGKTIIV